jgi:hypothetical protein
MANQEDLQTLPDDDLRRRCAPEGKAASGSRRARDLEACYELFRRAVRDGDETAWGAIYSGYAPKVEVWVKGHLLYEPYLEEPQFFANRAFEKMWARVSPERLGEFAGFAPVLRYLQMCVHSSLVQFLRGREKTERLDEYVDPVTEREALSASTAPPIEAPAGAGVEERAYVPSRAEELWDLLEARFQGENEHRLVYDHYVLGLRRQAILSRLAEVYASADELDAAREAFLGRLRRDKELTDFLFDEGEPSPNLESRLAGILYRAFCPESVEAGELALGLLPDERTGPVEEHLSTCPLCRRENELLESYLASIPYNSDTDRHG